MSYLNPLRLHFAGQFQASVSTVNNDPDHYNNATFKPNYQQPGNANGWWNPRGDGAWRLIGCHVTSAFMADGSAVGQADQIRMSLIADSDSKTSAKLVDLDPEQQLVSQIWGMEVRITDSAGNALVRGCYEPVGFMDIWKRIQQGQGDLTAGAMYQSVLTNLEWGDISASPFLQALKQAADDGLLSIKFNVESYSMASNKPNFTRGRIVGTIGPASATEPRHFVAGRQLLTTTNVQLGFFQPVQQINFCVAVVDQQRGKVYLDLGNALPISTSGGPPAPLGDLQLICIVDPIFRNEQMLIGSIPQATYTNPAWYPQTAGIIELPADRALSQDDLSSIASNPLWLRIASQSNKQIPAVAEHASGLYIRADQFVLRLNPDEQAQAQLYATQFGQPYPNAQVLAISDPSQLQQAPNTSPSAISFPAFITTNEQGIAELPIATSDPGSQRDFIDGQVYGIRVHLTDMLFIPSGNIFSVFNPANFISLLVWEAFEPAEPLTWWGTTDQNSIQSIFQQYANLYPVMQDFLDLSDYQSVRENIFLLQLAFGLDPSDPNSMPVTRDLSFAKRQAILRWMNDPQEGTPRPRAAPPQAIPSVLSAETPDSAAAPDKAASRGGKEAALNRRRSVRFSRHS